MAGSDSALQAALDNLIKRAVSAQTQIVTRSQVVAETAIKKQFTLAHARGAPGSPPGTPPAVVSGTLRRSVRSDTPTLIEGGVSGRTFPSTVYARIQELGGDTGRNHATHLPPRPYVERARVQIEKATQVIAAEEWARIVT